MLIIYHINKDIWLAKSLNCFNVLWTSRSLWVIMLGTANGNKSRPVVAFNKINKVILNCPVP
jgi:hypothetical protein